MDSATEGKATSFLWTSKSLEPDVFIRMPNKSRDKMKGPQAYVSFGDEGTTASVNAFGHIMQISHFAQYGSSGFVCADAGYERPYYVTDRMRDLMKAATDSENGLRLDLVDWRQFHNVPSLGYMYDRWPRFIYDQKPAEPGESSETSKKQKLSTDHRKKKHDETLPIPEKSSRLGQKASSNSAQSSRIPAFPLSIQYHCYKGSVVQKYLINLGEGGLSYDQVKWGDLSVTPDAYIRDLDFVKYNTFDSYVDSSDMDRRVISEDTLVISYNIPSPDSAKDDETPPRAATDEHHLTVALFISPFVNGKATKIEKIEEAYCIKIEEADYHSPDHFSKPIQLEITIAYTLKVLPQSTMEALTSSTDKSILEGVIKAEDIMEAMNREFQEHSKFHRVYFSQSTQLDLAYRRHLEHILSVCCIPLSTAENADPKTEDAERKAEDAESKAEDAGSRSGTAVATAITCGDISGHRIGPRASLSAVQYLIAMLTYLDPEDERSRILRAGNKKAHLELYRKPPIEKETISQTDYKDEQSPVNNSSDSKPWEDDSSTLHSRVLLAVKGHIRWICEYAGSDPVDKKGTFATHYWPTGSAIHSLDFLSPPSLVDTPIQLIKVKIYLEAIHQSDRSELNWTSLKDKALSWLMSLHDSNECATYAFSRRSRTSYAEYNEYEQSTEAKFSLTDHVMIAMATQCVEKILSLKQDQPSRSPSVESSAFQLQQLSLEQLQQSAFEQIQCYYTYKEVKRKILKRFTTEDPITKQRTLSTSRWFDKTRFLFHSKDTFLFFAAREDFFEKPDIKSKSTEYAKKSLKIDPFAKVSRRVDERWTRLLEVQSYHDELERFAWSNPLWCAIVFILSCKGKRVGNQSSENMATEVLRVLLQHASANGVFPGSFGPDCTPAMFDNESERDNYWLATFELPYVLWAFGNSKTASMVPFKLSGSSPAAPIQNDLQSFNKDVRGMGQQVGKHILFERITSTKDQTGLDLLSDDWLLNPPDVMHFEHETTFDFGKHPKDISKGKSSERATGIVINIPKYSMGEEIFSPLDARVNIFDHLAIPRTRWKSKKRIVWLPHCNESTTSACLNASSEVEKQDISLFLARHAKHDIYFFDSASAALNEWETQLHFSFYRISHEEEGRLLTLEWSKYLASITVSFHFFGDFADRFWTCYLLEDGTSVESSMSLGTRLSLREESGIRDELKLTSDHPVGTPAKRYSIRDYSESRIIKPWQQRRVLELLIYSKMLESMHNHSDIVFEEIRKLALNSKGEDEDDAISNLFERSIREARKLRNLANKDHYFSVASRWKDIAQIILVIEGNLSLNLERVNEWRRREKDRRNHQPRWTKEDEKNHRTTILRLEVFTERQARDIERLLDDIKKFRESLLSELETIRDDLSFRGSQNINLFTYVTIVFLPLGFATGVLSMSGRPQPEVLSSLYTLALGALGITIFALLNAKTVKTLVTPLVEGYGKTCGLLWRLTTFATFHLVAKHIIFHSGDKERKFRSPWARWVRKNWLGPGWYYYIKDFEIWKAMTTERDEGSKDPMPV